MAFSEAQTPCDRFTVKDMFHRESLEDLIAEGNEFKVIEHHCHNYSLFDIMPVEGSDDDLFHLSEAIYEFVEDPACQFTRSPAKFDIVLAEKSNGIYRRCIISSFVASDEKYAQVFWIDVGGTGTVEVASLKPVNEEIMKFPRVAYSVILDGMLPVSNYILYDDFVESMEKLRKVSFTVELGGRNEIAGPLYCKNKVKLHFKVSGSKIELRDHIEGLKKWEWESYSNLTGFDHEVCKSGQWGSREHRSLFMNSLPMPYRLSPLCKQFSATVSRVLPDEVNPGGSTLRLILINDRPYFNYFNVMHHQLARYAQHIKSKTYFPALDEPFMLKFAKKKENEKIVKCPGRWLRATRLLQDSFYLVDMDDIIRFTELPEQDYEMRPLYGEFYRVPQLCLTVLLTDDNGPVSFDKAEQIFQLGKRYQFTVVRELDYVYKVSYGPANSGERKLSMSYFLSSVDGFPDTAQTTT